MRATGDFRGPVFIVGMPRSGTKLLRTLLDRHPRVGIPPAETELLPSWARRWPEYGDLSRPEVFRAFVARHRGSAFFVYLREEQGIEVDAASWYAACRGFSLAEVFEALIRVTAEVPADGVWGDKSPNYIAEIPLIRRVWPTARVVHIVRDCRDYCLSIEKAWGKDSLRAAQRWADAVTAALEAGDALGDAHLRLHYEDLLAEPEATMRRVVGFLDLAWDPACVTLDRSTENLGDTAGEARIVRSNTGKWRDAMPADLRLRVEAVAGAALARAGYPVDNPGAARLSPGRMKALQLKDGVNLVRFDAAERGWVGAARFRWRIFRDSGAWE